MRREREAIAGAYLDGLRGLDALDLPPVDENRVHAWHLFPIRLRLEQLAVDRNVFIEELRRQGVMASVHWRPLHLHPYYYETFGWKPGDCRVATAVWRRLVSLPIFPGMSGDEIRQVIRAVETVCRRHARAGRADVVPNPSVLVARRGGAR
jgi:perosamine synthetase